MAILRARQSSRHEHANGMRAKPATEPDLIEETRAIWQKRTQRRLTREDAREIAENVVGFFDILLEWSLAERKKGRGKGNR